MTVTQWPSYLLRGVPADTRALLSEQAQADDISLGDVVRQALCHHYNMECDPASFGYQHDLDTGNDTLLVRVQPAVFKRMKRETRGRYGATKTLVFQALNDYLEVQPR